MTIDKTLKVKKGSSSARSVLKRGERLTRLKELERWKEGDAVLGLPKVRVMKAALRKKKKVKKEEEGAGGATPAAGASPAAGAKAAGAKAGAPAKKDAKK